MLCCQRVVKANDTSYYSDVVLVALLDYLVDVISIPDVADLSGCLVLGLKWNTVFLLEIDDYGIEFAVFAELDRIVYVGAGSDI